MSCLCFVPCPGGHLALCTNCCEHAMSLLCALPWCAPSPTVHPLHSLCCELQARVLLQWGPDADGFFLDINARQHEGRSALHEAARWAAVFFLLVGLFFPFGGCLCMRQPGEQGYSFKSADCLLHHASKSAVLALSLGRLLGQGSQLHCNVPLVELGEAAMSWGSVYGHNHQKPAWAAFCKSMGELVMVASFIQGKEGTAQRWPWQLHNPRSLKGLSRG